MVNPPANGIVTDPEEAGGLGDSYMRHESILEPHMRFKLELLTAKPYMTVRGWVAWPPKGRNPGPRSTSAAVPLPRGGGYP
ncbi:hypothetical protein GCM10023063_43970 [Arthrobacter methylotrophus]